MLASLALLMLCMHVFVMCMFMCMCIFVASSWDRCVVCGHTMMSYPPDGPYIKHEYTFVFNVRLMR